MTSPPTTRRPSRALTGVRARLLTLLTVVALLVLGAATASAAPRPDGQTRVRVSAPETITAVGVAEHIAAGQGRGPPASQSEILVATGVAAETAVGFADDAVASAYQGMRSGGGHAIRHLRDEGLIANSGSLSSQVAEFEQLTTPILRAPARTFDWRVGETMTRAFAGEASGRQVVVFVAKEGPYQGNVLSAVVPDAAQMAQWGLP